MKDLSHIVQFIHSTVSEIPNLREGGYKVERVNYNFRTPVYTQIGFLPTALWDKKQDHEKRWWIEQQIKNNR